MTLEVLRGFLTYVHRALPRRERFTGRAVFEPLPGSPVDESLVAFGTGRVRESPSFEDQFADAQL
jgi:hypothetical protein